MASATDIITYVGIPLAVLGVLPILYTFFLSIFTQRRIRHLLLTYGHKSRRTQSRHPEEDGFTLRASPMTSLIEVEMPRYTIAPLERADERYWTVNNGPVRHDARESEAHQLLDRVESTLSMLEEGRVKGFLRGGSWRSFNWKKLVVGRKMYRIQYEDELREPPAEIDFTDLVNFLMDWGVELDGMGWEKLRSGGLWTPTGTVLLRLPDETESVAAEGKGDGSRGTSVADRGDWVLRTSVPDDSDGILTLCVKWPQKRGDRCTRDAASLPPGWGRLRKPAAMTTETETDSTDNLASTIAALISQTKPFLHTDSIRFKLDGQTITKAHPESTNIETGSTVNLSRLSHFPQGPQWFTTTTSALLTLTPHSGSLWGFTPPNDLTTFSRKDTIPCGVLVLLSILPADASPTWTSKPSTTDPHNDFGQLQLRQLESRRQAETLESTMPPDQARVHRTNRQAREVREQHEAMRDRLRRQREWELHRLQDALTSARMATSTVADLCLKYLVAHSYVPAHSTVRSVTEATLYLLVLQSQVPETTADDARDITTEDMPVLRILEEWTAWTSAGGMKRDHFELLEGNTVAFCLAVCCVACVAGVGGLGGGTGSGSGSGSGRASVDMLECLRMWRKVRLG